MAIIVGDIHGNVEKVQAFLAYKPEVQHVALGDYLDSYCERPDRQIEALNLLLASDAVLLWGNHDLHYAAEPPWICSGYQHGRQEPYCKLIQANEERFLAAYAVDGWLCSHAGVAEKFTRKEGVEAVADRLNNTMRQWLEDRKWYPIFDIGRTRGGSTSYYGGIFWYDYVREWFLDPDIPQLFGHTSDNSPVVKDNYVCLDTTGNTGLCWFFDTQINDVVSVPMPERRKRCRDCLMLADYLNDDGSCTDCGRGI
jgi:hypothetical protein